MLGDMYSLVYSRRDAYLAPYTFHSFISLSNTRLLLPHSSTTSNSFSTFPTLYLELRRRGLKMTFSGHRPHFHIVGITTLSENYLDGLPEYSALNERLPVRSNIDTLPLSVLKRLFEVLPLSALATLTLVNSSFQRKILSITNPFVVLGRPGNELERAKFFVACFDKKYAGRLICYTCRSFHIRPRRNTRQVATTCKRSIGPSKPAPFSSQKRHLEWLDIHQSMRNLRYSQRHGFPILDYVSHAINDFTW